MVFPTIKHMKINKKTVLTVFANVAFVALITFVGIQLAQAQIIEPGSGGDLAGGTNVVTTLKEVKTTVQTVINFFIGLFWVLTVAALIYTAFLYLMSRGDEKKVESAKKYLLYTIIAAAVALFSTAVKPIVLNLLQKTGPTIQ